MSDREPRAPGDPGDPGDPSDEPTGPDEGTESDATGGLPAIERPAFLVAAATATVLLSFLPPGLRWVITPLVMWLPGQALICAVFGPRLEFGGVRRVCLALLLTLATYPILALAVFSLSVPMSHVTVALSTWVFVVACAGVVGLRRRRDLRHGLPPDEGESRSAGIEVRQLILPGLAIAAALLIVWASLHLLPRKDPTPYSAAAFSGPWALVSGAVAYDSGADPTVDLAVINATFADDTYVVSGRVIAADGSITFWTPAIVEVAAGTTTDLAVSGPLPPGECRAKLELAVTPADGDALDPLTVYFRDRAASCEPKAAGQ